MFAEMGGYSAFASREDVPLLSFFFVFNQRTQDRVSDRFLTVCSLPRHRLGCGFRVDVDGHDDALAHHHFASVQAHAVCAD